MPVVLARTSHGPVCRQTGCVRAVVVGSGPNGLTAAVVLARAGLDVDVYEAQPFAGGATRSSARTDDGTLHDHCAAIHPFGVASPILRAWADELSAHGLRWAWGDVEVAHPLDGGRAAVLHRSLDDTCAGLDADGERWRRLVGGTAGRFDDLVDDAFRPPLRIPRHPLTFGRFGLVGALPATWTARWWRGDTAAALFAGCAAHAMRPLDRPLTTSIGLLLAAAGHAVGWPVAVGGTQAVTDALAGLLVAHGGTIHTGVRVDDLRELGGADVTMLDTTPAAARQLLGDALPGHVERAYRRFRHGTGVFKVDLAVRGGIPWSNDDCRRAVTVHVGGTVDEIAAAEADVCRGKMTRRPFVLVGQQYLADPGRSVGDLHPVWAYAHVPSGHRGDATEAMLAQIERFAPGVRERIERVATRSVAETVAANVNFAGGDVGTGANTARQLIARPRLSADPYFTGIPGIYLCSAATSPGAGVHGMCGANAAHRALAHSPSEY